MKTPLPKRKSIRLSQYNYAENGAYFITLCARNRACVFSRVVGATSGRPLAEIQLTDIGGIVYNAIKSIPTYYPTVSVDAFVIMPNHVHILLALQKESGRPMVAPTVSTIVQQLKGIVTKQAGSAVWQKSFYDHVIRSEKDYRAVWEYIDQNPARWEQDHLYVGI
ncbi:MAG: transposase [Clostridia bacterium]|nr:transposase [Clostridia bacterium]